MKSVLLVTKLEGKVVTPRILLLLHGVLDGAEVVGRDDHKSRGTIHQLHKTQKSTSEIKAPKKGKREKLKRRGRNLQADATTRGSQRMEEEKKRTNVFFFFCFTFSWVWRARETGPTSRRTMLVF